MSERINVSELIERFKSGKKPNGKDFEDFIMACYDVIREVDGETLILEDGVAKVNTESLNVKSNDERLDPFLNSISAVNLASSSNVLRSGIPVPTIIDDQTIEFTTNTTYGHVGFTILNQNVDKKYVLYNKITNIGTVSSQNLRLMLAYGNQQNGGVSTNGTTIKNLGNLAVGSTLESSEVFSTANSNFTNAILGVVTNTNGANIRMTQKIYDVTNFTDNEIEQINWLKPDVSATLNANYSDVAGELLNGGSKWKGKQWLTLGDSITSPGTYQNLVKNALGFGSVLNKGVAGQGMSTMMNNVTNEEVLNSDLISIYGALNHMFPNAPAIGSVYDAPVQGSSGSFIAQLKYLIESVFTIKPTARLVIIGTHNAADQYRPEIYQPIRDGKNIGDYVLAMGEVARYYGCPFIDVYGKCGFNAFNLNLYTSDGAHPNALGYSKIAEVITNGLKNVEPI